MGAETRGSIGGAEKGLERLGDVVGQRLKDLGLLNEALKNTEKKIEEAFTVPELDKFPQKVKEALDYLNKKDSRRKNIELFTINEKDLKAKLIKSWNNVVNELKTSTMSLDEILATKSLSKDENGNPKLVGSDKKVKTNLGDVYKYANALKAMGVDISSISSEMSDLISKMSSLPNYQNNGGGSFDIKEAEGLFKAITAIREAQVELYNQQGELVDLTPLQQEVDILETILSLQEKVNNEQHSSSGGNSSGAEHYKEEAEAAKEAREELEKYTKAQVRAYAASKYNESSEIFDDSEIKWRHATLDRDLSDIEKYSNALSELQQKKEDYLSLARWEYNDYVANYNSGESEEIYSKHKNKFEEYIQEYNTIEREIEYVQNELRLAIENFTPEGDTSGAWKELIIILQELLRSIQTINSSMPNFDSLSSEGDSFISQLISKLDNVLNEITTLSQSMAEVFETGKIEEWKNAIIEAINVVKNQTNESVKNKLIESLLGWEEADKIMRASKTDVRERTLGFDDLDNIYGDYTTGKAHSSNIPKYIREEAKSKNVKLKGMLHSHPNAFAAMFSTPYIKNNNNIEEQRLADLGGWLGDYNDEFHKIEQEIIKANGEVLIFDIKKFFTDFGNHLIKDTQTGKYQFDSKSKEGFNKLFEEVQKEKEATWENYIDEFNKKFNRTATNNKGHYKKNNKTIVTDEKAYQDYKDLRSYVNQQVLLRKLAESDFFVDAKGNHFDFNKYGKIYKNDDFINKFGQDEANNELVECVRLLNELITKVSNIDLSKLDNLPAVVDQLQNVANKLEEQNAVIKNQQDNNTTESRLNNNKETEQEQKAKQESLQNLEEKLKYLQQIKQESKFLETAEERKMDMEEKAWDVGGNNPKSEADSQRKIQQYQELSDHIDKANDALDEFNNKYEKVLITLKNGQQIEIFDASDLDNLTLAKNRIQDIQFVLEKVDEEESDPNEKPFTGDIDAEIKAFQDLSDAIEEVKKAIHRKDELLGEEANLVRQLLPEEIEWFEKLNSKINDIITTIGSKITMIRLERAEVEAAIKAEIAALDQLINNPPIDIKLTIDDQKLIQDIKDALSKVDFDIGLAPGIAPGGGSGKGKGQGNQNQGQGGSTPPKGGKRPNKPQGVYDESVSYTLNKKGNYDVRYKSKNKDTTIVQDSKGNIVSESKVTSRAATEEANKQKEIQQKKNALYKEEKQLLLDNLKLNHEIALAEENESKDLNKIKEKNEEIIRSNEERINAIKAERKQNKNQLSDKAQRDEINAAVKAQQQIYDAEIAGVKKDKHIKELEAQKKEQEALQKAQEAAEKEHIRLATKRYEEELKYEKELTDLRYQRINNELEGKDNRELDAEIKKKEADLEAWKNKQTVSDSDLEQAILRNSLLEYQKHLQELQKIKEEKIQENKLDQEEAENVKTTTALYNNLHNIVKKIRDLKELGKDEDAEQAIAQFNTARDRLKNSKYYNEGKDEEVGRAYDVAIARAQNREDKASDKSNRDEYNQIVKILNAYGQVRKLQIQGIELTEEQERAIKAYEELSYDSIKDEKQKTELLQKEAKILEDINSTTLKTAKNFASKDMLRLLELQGRGSDNRTKAETDELNALLARFEQIKALQFETGNNANVNISDETQNLLDNYRRIDGYTGAIRDNLIGQLGELKVQDKYTQSFRDEWEALKKEIQGIDFSNLNIDEAAQKYKELYDKIDNISQRRGTADTLLATDENINKRMADINKTLYDSSSMSRKLRDEFRTLRADYAKLLDSDAPQSALDELNTRFAKLKNELHEAGYYGKSFFTQFREGIRNRTVQTLATYFSFQDIIRYGREFISTITELDTALVDLRKTTSMSASELDEFYYSSNQIAKQMGVTTREIIQQAANWSRLGYSTKEASETMAALSSQFAAISPGMDVGTATDGLVSAMKAFHVEVDNVESEIMDPVNRLGNTMATTNEEIVNMLERSSAAMYAANNSIQETLALESAAVQITRNAENTGTAFRTISMRIRGYDEETEELSEEYENLSGKIANLTKTAKTPGGISLFTDKDKTTFKSTYQLLKDISDIWDDLTDKQQAQLLEKLAGKRGGQVLAGILGKENFAEVERAMGEITKAAGSADAEMEIIRDSVEFKLNALKQTWIGYAQELLQRDDIGKIIDALINASEKLEGTLDVLAPVIEKTINIIAGLIDIIGNIVSVTGGATPVIIGLAVAFKKLDGIDGIKKKFEKFTTTLDDIKTTFETIKNLASTPDILKNALNAPFDDTKSLKENLSGAIKTAIEEGAKNSGDTVTDTLGDAAAEGIKNTIEDIDILDNVHGESLDDIFNNFGDITENATETIDQLKEGIEGANEDISTTQEVVENATAIKEALTGAEEANIGTTIEEAAANELEKDASLASAAADKIEADASLGAAGADAGEAVGSGASGAGGLAGLFKGGSIGAKAVETLAAAWPLVVAGIVAATAVGIHWYKSEEQVIKRTEESRKALVKLRDEYQKLADESSENVKSLSELIEQYKEAVKGSDEYYKIANQIAKIAPNTVIGHTVDGDAILGDISLLEEELQLLKDINEENRRKAEKENAEIVDAYAGNPTTDEGRKYKKDIDENKKDKARREQDLKAYNNAIKRHLEVRQKLIANARAKNPDITDEELKAVTAAADQEIKKYEELRDKAQDSIDNYNKQLDASKKEARKAYVGLLPSADDISDSEKALRDIVVDVAVEAELDSDAFDELYKKAEDAGEEVFKKVFNFKNKKGLSTKEYQQQAEELFNELVTALHLEEDEEGKLALRVSLKIDTRSIANARQEAVDWANKNKLSHGNNGRKEVDEGLISWYQNLNEEQQKIANSDEFTEELEKQKNKFTNIKDACQEAFNIVEKYSKATEEAGHKTVLEVLGEDGQKQLDDYYSTVSDIQEVINKINTGDYSAMDLNQWRVQYDLVGESAEEMVEELKDVEKESREAVIELIDNFIKANPGQTELIKSLELIKKGIEDVHKEAEKKINFNPGIDKLTKFNNALDSLKDSYIDFFKEGDQIDPGELSSIREVFGDLDEYQEFENAVLSGNADLDASFDKLVSAYANHNDVLEGLTEANKQYYITALKDQGIVNAQEVVEKRLAGDLAREEKMKSDLVKMNESLGESKKNLAIDSENLENATWEEIVKLMMEGEQAGITSEELVLFALKKALAADISLANSGDITYLLSLAETAGIAAEQIATLASAKASLESSQAIYSDYLGKYGANDRRTISMKSQVDRNTKALNDASKEAREAVANYKPSSMDLDFDFDARTAKGASGGGGSEETAETFDWIETKIQRLERDITNLGKTADATYKTWAERTIALGEEMQKVNDEINLQESAYNAYMAKANSIGLSEYYKNLVRNGDLRIDEITDESLKESINSYRDWYEKAIACKDKVDDLKDSLAQLARQKFDNVTAQFDDIIADVDHMTKYINAQMESVETVGKIAGKTFYQKSIEVEKQRLNDLTDELAQLQNALSEGLASGAIEYGSQMYTDMKKSIYGVEESIWDANKAILEFQENLKKVAETNFNDLVSQFENAISILTGKIDLTDKIVSLVQNAGHIVSEKYYESLVEAEDQNIKNLKKKYDDLSKVFDEAVSNGDVTPYSESWYNMREQLESIKGEIIDSTDALINYQKALRQIKWDLFDRGITRLEQLKSESEFLVELLSNKTLVDKDTAEFTKEGNTVKGLYVQNYEVLKNAVADYREEIQRLYEELDKDPGNIELTERIRELEEAQRSSILAMEEQKQKIKELYEQEFNALISLLDKLIQKYKDALQSQKDLYDYSKNIKNLNSNINSIKKQLMAYGGGLESGGDVSEENRARVQKLNQQLKEAEESLQEAEFNRYIDETGKLLDQFKTDLEDFLNEKLERLDELFEMAVQETNLNAETIRQVITETSESHNYTLTDEFAKIWENMTASDSIFSGIADIDAATNQVCSDIKAGIELLPTYDALQAVLSDDTYQIVNELVNVDSAVGNVKDAISETNTALGQISSKLTEYNASVLASIASAQAAAEKANQAAQQAQATANEAKSKAGSGDINSGGRSGNNHSVTGVVYNHGGMPIEINETGLSIEEAKARKEQLDRMYKNSKLTVHAKGGLIGKEKDNPLDFLAQQLGEDHMVAAKEGERILTAKQNENFEKLANAFSSLSSEDMAKYSILTGSKVLGNMPQLQMPTLRSMNAGNNTEINGGISINLPNVTNKEEFVEWLKTDGQIEKIVQSMTLGKLQGKNSYDKMKY